MITIAIVVAVVFVIYFAVGKIYNKFWEYKLNAEVFLPESDAFEGDITYLKEVVVNDKILPLPAIEIEFNLDKGLRFTNNLNSSVSDKLYRRDVFSAGVKRKITRTLKIYCQKRGYYTLDRLGIMTMDIFLQKKYLTDRNFFREFYVYPRRVKSEKLQIPYTKIMGEVLSRQKMLEDPFEFAGIRDYSLSDPMKFVNWKASAKSGKLVVNMHDSSLAQNLTIVFDTYNNTRFEFEELNEESIRICSALSERLLVQGMNLSIYSNTKDLLNGKIFSISEMKGLGIRQIRQSLAKLKIGGEKEIQHYFHQINKDNLLIVISKNTELSAELSKLSNDIVWIVPYKYEQPKIEKGKYNVIYWEYETPKLPKAVEL